MRSRTDLLRVLCGSAALAVIIFGYPFPAAAQSSTQPNTLPGSQHITINPGPPSGPDSFAPNPPPPPPPSGTVVLTPNNPDPGQPKDNPNSKKPQEDPGRNPDQADPRRTADEPRDRRTPDQAPHIAQPAGATDADSNAVTGIARTRAKAMESSALDAPRPTFSLLNSAQDPLATRIDTDQDDEFESGQILINVDSIEQAKTIQSQLAPDGYRVKSRRVFKQLDMVTLLLTTPPDVSAPEALASLSAQYPDLTTDLNHRYTPLGLSSSKTYAHALLGWQRGVNDCQVEATIGMIDTAIAVEHPVFETSDITQLTVLSGGTPSAPADHGTGVAALLVGDLSGEFAQGLVSGARLIAVEAFRSAEREQIDTTAMLVLAALDKLLSQEVMILNLSFGGPPNRLLEKAVRGVSLRGATLIAAAGRSNSGTPLYPAGYEAVIAVNAIDANLAPLKDTATGAYIDISAPGVDIWTATATGKGKYATGTSYAAPYVSAFAAILNTTATDMHADVVMTALKRAATDLGEPGHDHQFGWGLLSFADVCP